MASGTTLDYENLSQMAHAVLTQAGQEKMECSSFFVKFYQRVSPVEKNAIQRSFSPARNILPRLGLRFVSDPSGSGVVERTARLAGGLSGADYCEIDTVAVSILEVKSNNVMASGSFFKELYKRVTLTAHQPRGEKLVDHLPSIACKKTSPSATLIHLSAGGRRNKRMAADDEASGSVVSLGRAFDQLYA